MSSSEHDKTTTPDLRSRLAVAAANTLARAALRSPLLERALVFGCRHEAIRQRLHLDAVAIGYARVLRRRELRIAKLDGYRLHVNVAEPLGVHPYFFGESGAVWLTGELVRPGDICIDAGANAGHYTFHTAALVGPSGKVFAIEPNPEFSALIRKSRSLNGFDDRVVVDERAICDVSGEHRQFFLSTNPSNTGTSSLVNHGWYLSPTASTTVQTVTLDDLAESERLSHIRLLKIDVERAEHLVIKGASKLLNARRIDYIILEQLAGSEAEAMLRACGYTGSFIDERHRRLLPVTGVPRDTFGDYLFVSPNVSPDSLVGPDVDLYPGDRR